MYAVFFVFSTSCSSAESHNRLQAPAATGAHNTCFQQVQEDMCKAHSVCKEWEFVSKGTELSVGRFLIEYFAPLTLGEQ
jgi:hypothetical protein